MSLKAERPYAKYEAHQMAKEDSRDVRIYHSQYRSYYADNSDSDGVVSRWSPVSPKIHEYEYGEDLPEDADNTPYKSQSQPHYMYNFVCCTEYDDDFLLFKKQTSFMNVTYIRVAFFDRVSCTCGRYVRSCNCGKSIEDSLTYVYNFTVCVRDNTILARLIYLMAIAHCKVNGFNSRISSQSSYYKAVAYLHQNKNIIRKTGLSLYNRWKDIFHDDFLIDYICSYLVLY